MMNYQQLKYSRIDAGLNPLPVWREELIRDVMKHETVSDLFIIILFLFYFLTR